MKSQAIGGTGSLAERIAWYAILAVPLLVPTAVSKLLFSSIQPLTLNVYVYPKVFVLSVLMGIALTAWGIGVMRGTIRTRSVPLRWWLIAFLGLSALATITSMHPASSFFGGRYQVAGLLVFLLSSALFVLIVQLVNSAERVRVMSWSVVAGGVAVAVIGLLQAFADDPLGLFDLQYAYLTLRGGSLLGNPDFAGSYLVVPVVVAAALVLSAKGVTARIVGFGCFATMLVALLNTGTRGAWVGTALGLVMLGLAFVRSSGKVTRAGYIALGAGLGVPLIWILTNSSSFLGRFADLSRAETAGGGRLAIWSDAVRMIASRPLLGTGPDVYRLGWYGVRSLAWVRAVGVNVVNEDPHNVVLLFGATLGIPAAIAAIGLVVTAMVTSAGPALRRGSSLGRLILSGWWAALLAFAVAMLFATNSITMMVMLFVSLGMVVTIQSTPVEFPKAVKNGLAVAAIALALVAGVVGTLDIWADALLMRAERSADKVAPTQLAAQLAPWFGDAQYAAAMARGESAIAALEAGQPGAAQDAQSAEALFDRLVASNPREYQFRVGQAFYLANAGIYLGPETSRRAVAAGQAALDLNPLSSKAAYLKAFAQYNLGDYSGAVQTLKPLWEIDTAYLDPGTVYFRALLKVGDRAQAQAVLATLQQRFPGSAELAELGRLLEAPTETP